MPEQVADEIQSSQISNVEIQYDQRTALYASQFVVNGADDELLMDCSSGVVVDSQNSKALMPIHTRLAMSWGAARRLLTLLHQAINHHEERATERPQAILGNSAATKFAKLPKIETPINA
jgi:hypothetical protein